jgi:hypothetical protein
VSGTVDVIEMLRTVNPVPLDSIDVSALPSAAELRSPMAAAPTVVAITSAEANGRGPRRSPSKRPVWIAVAAAALVVITGTIALLVTRADDNRISTTDPEATTNPSVAPPPTVADVAPTLPPTAAPFAGIWVSTDTDGSSQTMEIVRSDGGDYELVLRDDVATTACSGAPSTMTGSGLLEADNKLVIAQPELTCDDGTIPANGPPPQPEFANFTLELDTATEKVVDSFGVVWRRAGSNDEAIAPSPVTVPALAAGTSGGMWPQATLDEVRAAQERADAGDPAYTWQLDAALAAVGDPYGAEVLARFIEEELGWEEFTSGYAGSGYLYAEGGGDYDGVVFIRCAPGQTNPLNPLFADASPEIRDCAPTIDELTYETVRFSVSQPDRRGPSGIWVVSRWEILQPKKSDPGSLWELLNPEFDQVVQVVPPTDAEVTAFMQAFLQARVDGEGAEQYLLREPEKSPFEDQPVPLLYATTGGAPFERFEIQRLQGPTWPNGVMEYKVRLFAERETVVEQRFHVVRHNGNLGLVYGYVYEDLPTTENGRSVAVPFSFLDGEVTFAVASQFYSERIDPTVMQFGGGRQHVVIAVDPVSVETGCENGPTPAGAEALASSIMADPDFEAIETVPVRIAGIDGLQIDGVVTAQWDTNWSLCYPIWTTDAQVFRIRLYLIDYPGEAAQVLTIAVIAPETDFERMLEQATPTVESLELHPGDRDTRAVDESTT